MARKNATLDTFTLKITLGNASMSTKGDVADALVKVAERIRREGSDQCAGDGKIQDLNGNCVGGFEFR